jgi:hypothetical protein
LPATHQISVDAVDRITLTIRLDQFVQRSRPLWKFSALASPHTIAKPSPPRHQPVPTEFPLGHLAQAQDLWTNGDRLETSWRYSVVKCEPQG